MSEELRVFKNSGNRFVGVQCHATSRQTGKRCRRFTGHAGLAVCRFHGGAVRRTREAADARLRALFPTAVDTIGRVMAEGDSMAAFRAARYVIKISGISEKNLWVDEIEQLAIEAGGPPSTLDEAEIEALVRSLSDTQAQKNTGHETDNTPPPA